MQIFGDKRWRTDDRWSVTEWPLVNHRAMTTGDNWSATEGWPLTTTGQPQRTIDDHWSVIEWPLRTTDQTRSLRLILTSGEILPTSTTSDFCLTCVTVCHRSFTKIAKSRQGSSKPKDANIRYTRGWCVTHKREACHWEGYVKLCYDRAGGSQPAKYHVTSSMKKLLIKTRYILLDHNYNPSLQGLLWNSPHFVPLYTARTPCYVLHSRNSKC